MDINRYNQLMRYGLKPGQIVHYALSPEHVRARFSLHLWPRDIDEIGEVPPYIYLAHEIAHKILHHQRSINYLNWMVYDKTVQQEEDAWALVLADFVYNAHRYGDEASLNEVRRHAIGALSTYYKGTHTDRIQKAQDFVGMIIQGTKEYIAKRGV